MNYAISSTEKAEGKALSALVTEPQRATIDSAEREEIPASIPVLLQSAAEIPSSVLVPQTFRLPQRLIEDLARSGELRALSLAGSRREYLAADKLKIYSTVRLSTQTRDWIEIGPG